MSRAPRSVMVAAALLAGAALASCADAAEHPVTVVSPPEPRASSAPVAVAEAASARPLAPPRPVAEPPAPTAHYIPAEPTVVRSGATQPPAATTPSPTPSQRAPERPSASPTPAVALAALLPRAAALAPLAWTDGSGSHEAAWTELAAPAALAPSVALPHVAAARATGEGCAAAADAVDAAAIEAASVSFSAARAPGAPIDLVLVRYPTPAAASGAITALQALGVACEGVATADGTLGTATARLDATAVLTGDGAALVVDATCEGAMLIAVVHEGARAEAVGALVAAQRAAL